MVTRWCSSGDRSLIHTKGSSGVSGRTAIVGRMFPREVAEELDKPVLEVDKEPEIDLELTCRGFKVGEEEDEELEGLVSENEGRSVLEEKVGVIVDDGIAFGMEIGIATGQKDQTLRP
jgi:hypothetical protein